MLRRKIEEAGLTLLEITAYIVLFTLVILCIICMFISISYYVTQKQQIEKPDDDHRKIGNNLENGLEKNEIETDNISVTMKYSMLTKEVNNSQQSTIPIQKTTLISKVSHAIKYEFKKIPSANCPFSDIKLIYGDMKACIKECNMIENCVGFVFHWEVVNHCWLKYKCDIIPSKRVVYLKQSAKTYFE